MLLLFDTGDSVETHYNWNGISEEAMGPEVQTRLSVEVPCHLPFPVVVKQPVAWCGDYHIKTESLVAFH